MFTNPNQNLFGNNATGNLFSMGTNKPSQPNQLNQGFGIFGSTGTNTTQPNTQIQPQIGMNVQPQGNQATPMWATNTTTTKTNLMNPQSIFGGQQGQPSQQFAQQQTTSSIFGGPQPTQIGQTGGNLFGGQGNTLNTLFSKGTTQQPNMLSTPIKQTGNVFQNAMNPTQTQPQTNMFGGGMNQPQSNMFGGAMQNTIVPTQTNTSMGMNGMTFQQGGQMMGGMNVGQQQKGSFNIQFQPTNVQEAGTNPNQTLNIKFQTISSMPLFNSKSVEEIRAEDYQLKKSGMVPQPQTGILGGTNFGQVLGQTNQTNQTNQSSLFGSKTTTTSTLWGNQPAQNVGTTSMFSQQTTSAPTFMNQGNTQQSIGGGQSLGGMFNQNKPAGGSSLFGGLTSTTGNAPTNTLGGQGTGFTAGISVFGNTSANTGATINQATTQPQTSSLFSTQPTTNTQNSLFSGQANQGSLFGNQSNQQATSFLNKPTQETSLLGATGNQQQTGLFGQPSNLPTQTGSSLFGTTNQPTQSSSLFGGQTTATSLFTGQTGGNTATTTTSQSLLGGQTSTQSSLLGGQPTQSTSLLGGQTGQSSLFGGQTSQPGGLGLFGQKQEQPKQEGAKTTSSLFGNTNNQGGGLFGATTKDTTGGGGLFGGTSNQSTSLFGGLDNKANTGGLGLFGGATSTQTQSGVGSVDAQGLPTSTSNILGLNINEFSSNVANAIQEQKKLNEFLNEVEEKSYEEYTDYLRRKSRPSRNVETYLTNYLIDDYDYKYQQKKRDLLLSARRDYLSSSYIGNSSFSYDTPSKKAYQSTGIDKYLTESFKKDYDYHRSLIEVDRRSRGSKPRIYKDQTEEEKKSLYLTSDQERKEFESKVNENDKVIKLKIIIDDKHEITIEANRDNTVLTLKENILDKLKKMDRYKYKKLQLTNIILFANKGKTSMKDDKLISYYNLRTNDILNIITSASEDTFNVPRVHHKSKMAPESVIPKTSGKYKMNPDYLTKINRMSTEQLKNVEDFEIWNEHGKIKFLGKVNLCNVDLDDVVDIEEYYIALYNKQTPIPPIGEGLNVKAEYTLYNMEIPAEMFYEEYESQLKMKVSEGEGKFLSYKDNELKFTKEYVKSN